MQDYIAHKKQLRGPGGPMRKHPILAAISAVIVIVVIIGAATSSKGSGSEEATTVAKHAAAVKTTTITVTRPAATKRTPTVYRTRTVRVAAQKPARAPKAANPQPQTFEGAGSENLGTIKVPADSTLNWSCGTCGKANFIVSDGVEDAHHITVNEINQTSGKTAVSAGVYHEVQVISEGEGWTITLTPGS